MYYLRARYYDPTVGRFTQEDTHWNTANMIYGDNPQKINERKDALGLKTYSYVPQISAVMQSGNLYVYCVNNPIVYHDETGDFLCWAIGAGVGAVFGALGAAIEGKTGKAFWGDVAGGAVSGAITGAAADIIIVTGGSGAPVIIAYAAAGGFGGVLGGITENFVAGTSLDSGEMIYNFVLGAFSGALGGATEDAMKPLAKVAASKGRSIGRQMIKTIQNELKEVPVSAGEEALSNTISWLINLICYMFGIEATTVREAVA